MLGANTLTLETSMASLGIVKLKEYRNQWGIYTIKILRVVCITSDIQIRYLRTR